MHVASEQIPLHVFYVYQVNDEHEALQAQLKAQQPDGPVCL